MENASKEIEKPEPPHEVTEPRKLTRFGALVTNFGLSDNEEFWIHHDARFERLRRRL